MRFVILTLIICNGAVVNALDITTLESLEETIFSYTGANQTYSFPDETVYLKVQLWGAGGGGSHNSGSFGGDGGYTESIIDVSNYEDVQVMVGARGEKGKNTNDNFGGGGGSGDDGNSSGGQGGGRSAIFLPNGTEILTAGGGGGGGYIDDEFTGGDGGGLQGGNGYDNSTTEGGGGTQSAGGAAGIGSRTTGEAGVAGQGGRGSITAIGHGGGGGGGGYYGGGGGGGQTADHGAGGGGSGFVGLSGSSALSGTDYGASGSLEDADGRTDTVSGITYYYTRTNAGEGSLGGQFGAEGKVVITAYSAKISISESSVRSTRSVPFRSKWLLLALMAALGGWLVVTRGQGV